MSSPSSRPTASGPEKHWATCELPTDHQLGLRPTDIAVSGPTLRSSGAVDRASRPDLRVLRQIAERLEASVQGSAEQILVRQLIETLAGLTRTLQGQSEMRCDFGEAGAISAGLNSDSVLGAHKSPRWLRLLAELAATSPRSSAMIAVVDRDPDFRSAICIALEAEGLTAEAFATCDLFLQAHGSRGPACLIVDSNSPGMSGLKLLRTLSDQGHALPVIVVAEPGEVHIAVDAMKAGVVDFLEKPIACDVLFASVELALVRGRESQQLNFDHDAAANRMLELTTRQRQVMDLILAGHPSKNIAVDIGVSQRTVESHRAEVMRKTGAKSMPALARFAATAAVELSAPLKFDFVAADRHAAAAGNDLR